MIAKRMLIFIIILFFTGFTQLQAQSVISVYPTENPDALRNPLKGFRPDPNSAKKNTYPTIVRDYITWNAIEKDSTDDVQKIIDFCNARWKDYEKMNIKVIPRVYILWDSNDKKGNWPADLTYGDWSSPKFKDRVVKLIYKLGLAWDNDPRVAWVQTGIIGWWGEQENPVGVDEDGWAKRLGVAYSTAFTNKKLLVRNQKVWESAGYKLGTYWDSYGHPSQSGVHTEIKDRNNQGRYETEIIEGETAYNWGNDKWNPKYGASPTITLNNNKFTTNLIDAIRDLHCTGLGWIASYKLDGSEGSTIDTVKANASRMQKAFGYNYVIPEFSCSPRADQGGNFAIRLKVKNNGSAPFYENWPLAFVLIDESTKEIIWKEHLKSVDIRKWLPGDKYNYTTKTYQTPAIEYVIDTTLTVPSTILTGQYMAGMAILEPYSQTPGVFFDVKNFLSKSQTQPLCRVGIGEDLVGDYEVDPSIFGNPVTGDTRSYSLIPKGFSYNLSVNISNGTVLLHPAGGKYLPGTKVTVIVKNNIGYNFTSWSGDLSGVDKVTTIIMDGDKSITANIEKIVKYELKTNAINGSIGTNPFVSTYDKGALVTLKASPDFGYQFSGWSGDLLGMENPTTISMDANKSITATFTQVEGTVVFATNCGGPAFTSSDGINYSADTAFVSGNTFSTNNAIAGTTDDLLYQTERYGANFSYTIPLPNGTYQVMLMFAEILSTSANSRVFNVAIDDIPVITNLDIWSIAGAKAVYNENHFVTVTNEALKISFSGVKYNAKISAIKILQTSVANTNNVVNRFPKQPEFLRISPNPFSSKTTIHYQLHEGSIVKLSVFNLLGEHISTILNQYQAKGNYSVDWNTIENKGKQLENGLYLFKMETDKHTVQIAKSFLLR